MGFGLAIMDGFKVLNGILVGLGFGGWIRSIMTRAHPSGVIHRRMASNRGVYRCPSLSEVERTKVAAQG